MAVSAAHKSVRPTYREPAPAATHEVFSGDRRARRAWPGLSAEYSWLPPFEGAAVTRPNRLEVVFSSHARVALEQEGSVHDVCAPPGGCYVIGPNPTTLLRVHEHSDTLEMYPEMDLLRAAAAAHGVRNFELEPTLRGTAKTTFAVDPIVVGVAHMLRRACLGAITLSDIGASQAAHTLAARVLQNQYRIRLLSGPGKTLSKRQLGAVGEHIEAHLEQRITLDELARLAAMSPFHFCRSFKRTTGLAPHQYVLARRIDLAKRRLTATTASVQNIAWSIGFENVNHFRRQFAAQFGVTPGTLRSAIRTSSAL